MQIIKFILLLTALSCVLSCDAVKGEYSVERKMCFPAFEDYLKNPSVQWDEKIAGKELLEQCPLLFEKDKTKASQLFHKLFTLKAYDQFGGPASIKDYATDQKDTPMPITFSTLSISNVA
jgi:hypothetical protein